MPNNHGRIIVPLLTSSGNLGAVYGISGRSPESKRRMITVYPEENRVYVGPIGEITEKQVPVKDLIFYNGMRVRDDGLLIVTNGAQTDQKVNKEGKPVRNFYDDFDLRDPERSSVAILQDWGYEDDAFFPPWVGTPRTAMVRYPNGTVCLSMVTKCGDRAVAKAENIATGAGTRINDGTGLVLSTYIGNDEGAIPWYLALQSIGDTLRRYIDFDSNEPVGLADELYRWMDPTYVAATAGAVFDGGKWHFDAVNRHETPESFETEFPPKK
ncbi:MAG TPA: IMP cyclohydrolase [archaeon]|nr:IMP cyclohydrolase [archaeon]